MQETLEIFKYVLPSVVVLITAYFLLKIFLNSQEEIKKKELQPKIEELRLKLKKDDKQHFTPIKISAFERMILLLERISPQSLVFRVQKPGIKVFQLQASLLKNIRDEYEHNLAQQLYISAQSWAVIKAAKEDVVNMINDAAAQLKPDDDALALSKAIFERYLENDNKSIDKAIDMLKLELLKFME